MPNKHRTPRRTSHSSQLTLRLVVDPDVERGRYWDTGHHHGEHDIVFLEAIEQLDYVRECVLPSPYRVNQPRWWGPGRLVAYATLDPTERRVGYRFRRRAWVLFPWDHYGRGAPVEAVDPLSIRAGCSSLRTARVDRDRRAA